MKVEVELLRIEIPKSYFVLLPPDQPSGMVRLHLAESFRDDNGRDDNGIVLDIPKGIAMAVRDEITRALGPEGVSTPVEPG